MSKQYWCVFSVLQYTNYSVMVFSRNFFLYPNIGVECYYVFNLQKKKKNKKKKKKKKKKNIKFKKKYKINKKKKKKFRKDNNKKANYYLFSKNIQNKAKIKEIKE